jgi:indole-3-glycerol phosphate synthase
LNVLHQILRHKVDELATRKARAPRSSVVERAASAPPARDFRGALRGRDVAIIAEIKRVSPARGPLRTDLDAPLLASGYVAAGATAVSVLTDERFFGGSDQDLVAVRAAIDVPVLRKDFVIDPYQIYEARALGADAVLLIVGALDPSRLSELLQVAASLGIAALVEVHDERELGISIGVGASLVGINNRDLTRLEVDLDTTFRLRPIVPAGVVVVSESGIRTPDQVRRLAALPVDGVLIGEALVTAPDPQHQLLQMLAAGRREPRVESAR